MNDERLKKILNEKAESAIPDTLDMRSEIYGRLNMKQSAAPRLRLLRPALVALIIFALATAAYAFYQSRIRPDAGLSAVQAENKTVPINQSRSISTDDDVRDMTITLDYAFADSNRVVVGYHVTGSAKAGDGIQLYTNPTLADDQGRSYYWLPAGGQQASNPTGEGADPEAFVPFRTEGLMSFDSSVWPVAPPNVNLNLRIEVAYTNVSTPYAMKLAGETTFEFNLPVNPGRIVAAQQTADGADMSLQLQKVVIAPSLTRLEICAPDGTFTSGDDNWIGWMASVTVDVNAQRVVTTSEASFAGLNGQPIQRESGCRALVIPAPLVAQTGAWQVTITEFTNPESGERLSGPWVFNFSVPS